MPLIPRIKFPTNQPGNSQHHLDCRVHSAKPEGENQQLHQCILRGTLFGVGPYPFLLLFRIIGDFSVLVRTCNVIVGEKAQKKLGTS